MYANMPAQMLERLERLKIWELVSIRVESDSIFFLHHVLLHACSIRAPPLTLTKPSVSSKLERF